MVLLLQITLVAMLTATVRSFQSGAVCLSGIRFIRTKSRPVISAGFGKRIIEVESDPGNVKGTSLKILKYPNPKLRTENEEIVKFDEELENIAKEMLLVMYAAEGIGLAAPQVGVNKRLMVFNSAGDKEKASKEIVLANPTIISSSANTDLQEEGCLSFPQIYGKVERSLEIEVEYQTLKGEKLRRKFDGIEARVFQHEWDHLNKVLFIDRLVAEDKAVNAKRLEKAIKKFGPGGLP